MSFNSVTLTIAGAIFVVLLAMTAYFIYQDQKTKFSLIQATCPDYWLLKKYEDGPHKGKHYCEPSSRNMGTCRSPYGAEPAYYGPNKKIWNDRDCKPIGGGRFLDVKDCQKKCDSTQGCTAFNYQPTTGDCILRECSTGKEPSWDYPPYVGYSKYSTQSSGAENLAPKYNVVNDTNECTNYKNKMTWVNNVCGKKVLWDGVTNNAELKGKCK